MKTLKNIFTNRFVITLAFVALSCGYIKTAMMNDFYKAELKRQELIREEIHQHRIDLILELDKEKRANEQAGICRADEAVQPEA